MSHNYWHGYWFMTMIGYASLGVAMVYAVLNVAAVLVRRIPRHTRQHPDRPPATVLKPLCGAEPGLYEHLRSFCLQDYPRFEIVFGIRDHNDPARIVAQRLAADFPALSIKIVVDPRLHGGNYKISNLLNMLPHAQYDLLVMADSDACVGPDYLATVTAPLGDAKVGLVTCVYRGRPTSSIWSRLGAM